MASTSIRIMDQNGNYRPGSYNTIQDAINAARVGDTVMLGAGLYNRDRETITLKAGISVKGAGTSTVVTSQFRINGENSDSGRATKLENLKVNLSGSVRGEDDEDDCPQNKAAIYVASGKNIVINQCEVSKSASGNDFSGIIIASGITSGVTVSNNTFNGNFKNNLVTNGASAVISGNTFTNGSFGIVASGAVSSSVALQILNNTFAAAITSAGVQFDSTTNSFNNVIVRGNQFNGSQTQGALVIGSLDANGVVHVCTANPGSFTVENNFFEGRVLLFYSGAGIAVFNKNLWNAAGLPPVEGQVDGNHPTSDSYWIVNGSITHPVYSNQTGTIPAITDPAQVFVDRLALNYANGTIFELNGKFYQVGVNLFSTVAAADAAVSEGGTISIKSAVLPSPAAANVINKSVIIIGDKAGVSVDANGKPIVYSGNYWEQIHYSGNVSMAAMAGTAGKNINFQSGVIATQLNDASGIFAHGANVTIGVAGAANRDLYVAGNVQAGNGVVVLNSGFILGSIRAGGDTATSSASGRIEMNGGWVNLSLEGGGAPGSSLAVSNVIVRGGTVGFFAPRTDVQTGVFGGGEECTVGTANVTISGGVITTNVYGGGLVNNAGSADVELANVLISGGSLVDVYGGGLAYLASGSNFATAETEKVALTIQDGTISGSVYGGGRTVLGAGASGVKTETGDITIEILGGSIAGNVVAGGASIHDSVTGDATIHFQNGTIGGDLDGSAGEVAGLSTLNVDGGNAKSVNTVRGFDRINVSGADTEFSADRIYFGEAGINEDYSVQISGGAELEVDTATSNANGAIVVTGSGTQATFDILEMSDAALSNSLSIEERANVEIGSTRSHFGNNSMVAVTNATAVNSGAAKFTDFTMLAVNPESEFDNKGSLLLGTLQGNPVATAEIQVYGNALFRNRGMLMLGGLGSNPGEIYDGGMMTINENGRLENNSGATISLVNNGVLSVSGVVVNDGLLELSSLTGGTVSLFMGGSFNNGGNIAGDVNSSSMFMLSDGTLNNSGTFGLNLTIMGIGYVDNTGTIAGDIRGSIDADILTLSGHYDNNVSMGDGDDSVSLTVGATFLGTLDFGSGSNTLTVNGVAGFAEDGVVNLSYLAGNGFVFVDTTMTAEEWIIDRGITLNGFDITHVITNADPGNVVVIPGINETTLDVTVSPVGNASQTVVAGNVSTVSGSASAINTGANGLTIIGNLSSVTGNTTVNLSGDGSISVDHNVSGYNVLISNTGHGTVFADHVIATNNATIIDGSLGSTTSITTLSAGNELNISNGTGSILNGGYDDNGDEFASSMTALVASINNSGHLNLNLSAENINIGTNLEGATINGNYQATDHINLDNAGTVSADFTADSISVVDSGAINGNFNAEDLTLGINQSGSLRGDYTGSSTLAVINGGDVVADFTGGAFSLNNYGMFNSVVHAASIAIAANHENGTILGTYQATGAFTLDNYGMFNSAVNAASIAIASNHEDGTILGTYQTGGALSLDNSGEVNAAFTADSGVVTNSGSLAGSISARTLSLTNAATGSIAGTYSGSETLGVSNSGHIDATLQGGAFTLDNYGYFNASVNASSISVNTNHAGGVINGSYQSSGMVAIDNAGTISADFTGGLFTIANSGLLNTNITASGIAFNANSAGSTINGNYQSSGSIGFYANNGVVRGAFKAEDNITVTGSVNGTYAGSSFAARNMIFDLNSTTAPISMTNTTLQTSAITLSAGFGTLNKSYTITGWNSAWNNLITIDSPYSVTTQNQNGNLVISVSDVHTGDFVSSGSFTGTVSEKMLLPGNVVSSISVGGTSQKVKLVVFNNQTGKKVLSKNVYANKSYTYNNLLFAGNNTYTFQLSSSKNTNYTLHYDTIYHANTTNKNVPINFSTIAPALGGGYVGWQNPSEQYHFTVTDLNVGTYTVRLNDVKAKTRYSLVNLATGKTIQSYYLSSGTKSVFTALTQGSYAIVIASGDKGKGKYNTTYEIIGTLSNVRSGVNSANNSLASATEFVGTQIGHYVGLGDKVNYYRLAGTGEFTNFALAGDNGNAKGKFLIYNESGKKVYSGSIKNGSFNLNDLVLAGGKNYFVRVESASTNGKHDLVYELESSRNSYGSWNGDVPNALTYQGEGSESDYLKFTALGSVNFNLDLAVADAGKFEFELYTLNSAGAMKKVKTFTTLDDRSFDLKLTSGQQYFLKLGSVDSSLREYDLTLQNAMVA